MSFRYIYTVEPPIRDPLRKGMTSLQKTLVSTPTLAYQTCRDDTSEISLHFNLRREENKGQKIRRFHCIYEIYILQ